MRTRVFAALAGSILAAGLLAGCATPAASGSAPDPGEADSAPEVQVGAGWLDGAKAIALVTWGSSSCVPAVGETALKSGVLVVSLREPEPGPCTDDLVARPLEIATPSALEPADGLRLRVSLGDSSAEVDLGAYSGGPVEEFTPSAAWVGDRTIALRTWGSSTCPPVVADTRAESPASVVVRFVVPDADQMCTADVAPQLTIVQLDPDTDVNRDATLSFGVLDAAGTVPIR
ncbi:hypothetical protein BWL13_00275 [Microbacterium oleivorans]|uniref:hypothetical protein n=1 Tax=Microbacterium oleivorans TaxID=273677 RepID=UPI0009777681|nr:hypothetical protein [Microbacterium oleivorans]AZS42737.1 hypothetical protein BWL13_00275 [Microbacterium oleivorans]